MDEIDYASLKKKHAKAFWYIDKLQEYDKKINALRSDIMKWKEYSSVVARDNLMIQKLEFYHDKMKTRYTNLVTQQL